MPPAAGGGTIVGGVGGCSSSACGGVLLLLLEGGDLIGKDGVGALPVSTAGANEEGERVCSEGMLVLKVSRFGAGYFIGCNQHPKCK
ncbi:hypothetical protein Taro_004198 [Colocasia esculenta]|uniref:DNA topoisomerase type IA zn finger domain-containing protein n=1 Tax=Colocasia esculenta TaxID=4460 RepID=A0A843TNU8_COLES|nr:hypothetical protein [Colocasia esculenta]